MEGYQIGRRDFMKKSVLGMAGLMVPDYVFGEDNPKKIKAKEFSKLPSPDYYNISHDDIKWENASEGLDFSRTNIYRNKELVDIIAAIKINPEKNKLRVFNGYISEKNSEIHTIEDWQKKTNALAMINSAQYMADPLCYPCALIICDGKQKGPKRNNYSRGMLLAEPKDNLENKIKKMDLLDFEYDSFDYANTPYQQGVQHWPILLDREGKIKVNNTSWQANRTIVAKTKNEDILFLTTEGGYFTLYNFGRFLRGSNQRKDKGFDVHTAMNMDGGYEASMVLKTPQLDYVTYGEFETYGPNEVATIFDIKIEIPGAIGVFPRN